MVLARSTRGMQAELLRRAMGAESQAWVPLRVIFAESMLKPRVVDAPVSLNSCLGTTHLRSNWFARAQSSSRTWSEPAMEIRSSLPSALCAATGGSVAQARPSTHRASFIRGAICPVASEYSRQMACP